MLFIGVEPRYVREHGGLLGGAEDAPPSSKVVDGANSDVCAFRHVDERASTAEQL